MGLSHATVSVLLRCRCGLASDRPALRLPELRPGVRCPTGEARITRAFDLPARFVIHTVGPIWRGGAEREHDLLASCYRSVLALCPENGIASLAFPAISCGVFGFPVEAACTIAAREISAAFTRGLDLDVRLVAFDPTTHAVMSKAVAALEASFIG